MTLPKIASPSVHAGDSIWQAVEGWVKCAQRGRAVAFQCVTQMSSTVLVTGAAGFIGAAVSQRLLDLGHTVIGIDNLNDYYDPALKRARLQRFQDHPNFELFEIDIEDDGAVDQVFRLARIDRVCHMAAQAGVRFSLEEPMRYVQSNVAGTVSIFEACRNHNVRDVVFASSSSVYGNSDSAPFNESQPVNQPVSLYAASKVACEALAYSYHQLFGLNMTGLRFFTVYGPWGRPDMAPMIFAGKILADQPIQVFNHGRMQRDFTYIDDIVDGVVAALDRPFSFELINLGGADVTELEDFIAGLEKCLGKKAERKYLPMQLGDVLMTSADTSKAQEMLGWAPRTSLEEGLSWFCDWYLEYFKGSLGSATVSS